jgi:hypothetical protein
MGDGTRTGCDQSGAVTSEAGDAVNTRGLKGLGQGHLGEDRLQAPGKHRFPCSRKSQEKDVMGRTPAYHVVSAVPHRIPMDPLLHRLVKLAHPYGALLRPFVK